MTPTAAPRSHHQQHQQLQNRQLPLPSPAATGRQLFLFLCSCCLLFFLCGFCLCCCLRSSFTPPSGAESAAAAREGGGGSGAFLVRNMDVAHGSGVVARFLSIPRTNHTEDSFDPSVCKKENATSLCGDIAKHPFHLKQDCEYPPCLTEREVIECCTQHLGEVIEEMPIGYRAALAAGTLCILCCLCSCLACFCRKCLLCR
mmetsp:Transcript_62236/g.135945  ORF Transcript_62236/g.135945 Transcript_62236/m.135945 type:complete len:201 (+) Transcript_62236:190-792(+)